MRHVLLHNIRKIDVNIRNCRSGREGATVLWDSFYDLRQSCVLLCVYVMRDPRAFTRAAIANKRGKRTEAEAVTLSPVSSVRPPKFPSSLLSKFCKSVPRAHIKCPSSLLLLVASLRPRFESRNFGATPATHSAM